MSSFIRLAVTSKKFIFNMNLYRRITYIRGDGGLSKNILLYYLENRVDTVSCDKNIKILKGLVTWKEFENDIGNTLFIMDDALITGRVGFSNSIIKHCIEKDSYLLVLNGVDFIDNLEEAKYIDGIDCSAKEIYVMKGRGKYHWCEPLYAQEGGVFTVKNTDLIVTEDFHGMYDFCKNYFKVKVFTTKGKDQVIKFLIENAESLKGKNILLFVDTASYGKYFDILRNIANIFDFTINLDMNYECFEYFLLKTNLLNTDWVFSSEDANNEVTWEQYFENVIEECTFGYIWKYKHGKRPRGCYLEDCGKKYGCNEFVQSKCKKQCLEKSKLEYLLNGTEFEYLLGLEKKPKEHRSVRETL